VGHEFVGGAVWPAITKACRGAGPRYAAIAYLGPDAATLLPLKAADVLVVNLDPDTLLARATSVAAIRAYVAAGVHVFPSRGLHAKVLATRDLAVVGSANASARSRDWLSEAAIVVDTATQVRAVTAFVKRLVRDSDGELDASYLAWAQRVWNVPRHMPGHGSTGRSGQVGTVAPPGRFPRDPAARMFLTWVERGTASARWERVAAAFAGEARRVAGPATRFHREAIAWHNEQPALRAGDVLVQLFGPPGRERLWLTEVLADPFPVGTDSVCWVRWERRQPRVLLDDADQAISTATGAPLPRPPDRARQVRSRALRDAILGLWP
jgi:hypothetical protein